MHARILAMCFGTHIQDFLFDDARLKKATEPKHQ
jgi:hypothetical protein